MMKDDFEHFAVCDANLCDIEKVDVMEMGKYKINCTGKFVKEKFKLP